jgi:uncharacterized protein YdbL (DUF1318 family)
MVIKGFLVAMLLVGSTPQDKDLADGADYPALGGGERSRASVATARPIPTSYDGSTGALRIETPALSSPDISVDGRLNEEAWSRAARLGGFTQYDPVEGLPATQDTEVMVFVSDDAIYFGVRALDSDPDRIRAILSQRDKHSSSNDYVRFILDTFDDQRRAYAFTVNPLGVQEDGLWIDGSNRRGYGDPIDTNPDFLWESEGRVEDWGYVVEVKIPFKSLRFRNENRQDWGLQVVRRIYRNGFEESWAPITANQANKLTQMGKLRNLRGLNPGLFMEINPELTGRRVGTVSSESSQFGYDTPEAQLGLNFTYGITSNLRFDATYNPDFSQIEADAGQIVVNERFAQFFPEARPFFLEGTEIFQLPRQLVYTRTIVDPLGGAKLTGKVGSLNVGYLGAVDRDAEGAQAFVNLARARQDIGQSSTVGLTLTDRTASRSDYNRVASADARLILARRYTVEVMGAGSVTGSTGAGSIQGGLLHATVRKSGRTFTWNGGFEDIHPDFRARSGFIRRVGDTRLNGEARYSFWGAPGALIERVSPSLEVQGYWDHDAFWGGGRPKEGQIEGRVWASLRGNMTVSLAYTREFFDFATPKYEGLFVPGADQGAVPFVPDASLFRGMDGLRASFRLGGVGSVRGSFGIGVQETPIFDRGFGVPVEPADEFSVDAGLTFIPTRALSLEGSIRHLRLNRSSDGSRYSTATIPRIRAQYQFTKAFYVRLIGEYAAQESGELRDPVTGNPISSCTDDGCAVRTGRTSNSLSGQGLVAYEPSPGTVVYLGYTRQMSEISAFRFQELDPVAEGLFVKFSYRFRL